MGMFDSLYDAEGTEWQTKAFACTLERFNIGDKIPSEVPDFQVRVLGERMRFEFEYGLATVRGGILVAVPDDRDPALPFIEYSGHLADYVYGGDS